MMTKNKLNQQTTAELNRVIAGLQNIRRNLKSPEKLTLGQLIWTIQVADQYIGYSIDDLTTICRDDENDK